MKVFISQSGERSLKTAEAFAKWLPQIIQSLEPWVSKSIPKGGNWRNEVMFHLDEADIGIVCLTSDNLDQPWLLFEAGALATKLIDKEGTEGTLVLQGREGAKGLKALVCTFLLDVKHSDVKDPLAMFQYTDFEKSDILKLLKDINKQLKTIDEKPIEETLLIIQFERVWEEFNKDLNHAKGIKPEKVPIEPRQDAEILREILEKVREIPVGFSSSMASIATPYISATSSPRTRLNNIQQIKLKQATLIRIDSALEDLIGKEKEAIIEFQTLERKDPNNPQLPEIREKITNLRMQKISLDTDRMSLLQE